MKLQIAKHQVGDVVQISSSEWFVWNGDYWHPLALEDQDELTVSKDHLVNCAYLGPYDYMPNECNCGFYRQIGFTP